MSCGCGSSKKVASAGPCGCAAPTAAYGSNHGDAWAAPTVPTGVPIGDGSTGGSMGSRLSVPWGGGGAGNGGRSRTPSTRAVPIGVRPTVPEPTPFLPGSYPGLPGSIGQDLADLFPSGRRVILDQAEIALRKIPESRRPAAVAALLQVPEQLRLTQLLRISSMNGEIPDHLPGSPAGLPQGDAAETWSIDGALSSARTRQVAPPPAPQQVCLVNGYDPRWGPPPPSYLGVPLQFDVLSGSYVFDQAWAIKNSPRISHGQQAWSRADYNRIKTSYERSGLTLQPFRRSISSPWEFRWVVHTHPPQIRCETA